MKNTGNSHVWDIVEENIHNYAKDYALEIMEEMKAITPVDTGHAKSNWHIGIGEPDDKVFGSRESVTYRSQQRSIKAVKDMKRVVEDLYILNNVFYLPILNSGYFAQYPAGFIEAGIKRARNRVRRMYGNLRRQNR